MGLSSKCLGKKPVANLADSGRTLRRGRDHSFDCNKLGKRLRLILLARNRD